MRDGNEKLYDFKARSDEAGLLCEDESRTVQADAADTDINNIVRRMNLLGEMPSGLRVPQYADYEDVHDFLSAQQAIATATEDFMSIPAEVRARFQNSPQLFLEFVSDKKNTGEMVDLGILDKSVLDTVDRSGNVLPPPAEPANGGT